jgi:hypothetical protein
MRPAFALLAAACALGLTACDAAERERLRAAMQQVRAGQFPGP